jgi:hypothetical protein
VDKTLFARPLFAAIDGNALYEAHRVADRLAEERRETTLMRGAAE